MSKINEIKASEWAKSLTEEQLNTDVILRDNWGDVVMIGTVRRLLEINWIDPLDGIDIDNTNVEGGNVYLGTMYMESEDME